MFSIFRFSCFLPALHEQCDGVSFLEANGQEVVGDAIAVRLHLVKI
jgi:hypothetical protein